MKFNYCSALKFQIRTTEYSLFDISIMTVDICTYNIYVSKNKENEQIHKYITRLFRYEPAHIHQYKLQIDFFFFIISFFFFFASQNSG